MKKIDEMKEIRIKKESVFIKISDRDALALVFQVINSAKNKDYPRHAIISTDKAKYVINYRSKDNTFIVSTKDFEMQILKAANKH